MVKKAKRNTNFVYIMALSNYEKGEIAVLDGEPNKYFPDLPPNIVNVKVKPGSKMRKLLEFALRIFREKQNRQIIVSGSGDAMYKTISCAEIIKRKIKNLHQVSAIGYLRLEEYWEPKNSELDRLKVTREIPQIHILLSKDLLDSTQPGYQGPGDYSPDKNSQHKKSQRKAQSSNSERPENDRRTGSQQRFTPRSKPRKRKSVEKE